MIKRQRELLEWIDRFQEDNYRPPCIEDITNAGFRYDIMQLVQDRRELIALGHLLPTSTREALNEYTPLFFIPSWMKPFIDFQRNTRCGYKKIIEAVKHGYNKVGV